MTDITAPDLLNSEVPRRDLWATAVGADLVALNADKAESSAAVLDGDAAAGDLGGTYPNPTLSAAKQAELDAKETPAGAQTKADAAEAAANAYTDGEIATEAAARVAHETDTANPHGVTAAQTGAYHSGGTDVAVLDGGTGASDAATARTNLGLGNVDNTSDANKPVSTAQQAALDGKVAKATFDANTILKADTDDTPAALTVAEQRIVGRVTGGQIAALTIDDVLAMFAGYAPFPSPRPGWVHFGDIHSARVQTATQANICFYARRISKAVPISQVSFVVSTQVGNISVAAYDHNPSTHRPGNRLATTGDIACPAAGMATVSLGATVTPEWLGISFTSASAAIWMSGPTVNANYNMFTGIGAVQISTHPLPNPAGASAEMSFIPVMVGKP